MPFPDTFARWRDRAVASFHKRGIAGTIRLLPGLVAAGMRGDPDVRFDQRYGVDTAGILKPASLQSDPKFRHSNWYAPSSTGGFRRMLRDIEVDHEKFVFIDFGCGKGKALLLASALPFREIIGVEIWPEMVSIAEENLRKYRGNRACRVARLHCLDASEYSIPADPGVFYFFDPFRETVTRKVLENLRQSLLVHPREVYVIYCEPERPDLLDNCGFLALLKRTEHYSIYGSAKVPG